MLGIIDEKTGKDTYPDWTKFKTNVLIFFVILLSFSVILAVV